MIQAISACPGSIAEILELIEKIRNDEIKVDEVVEAIIDPNEVLLTNWAWGIWKPYRPAHVPATTPKKSPKTAKMKTAKAMPPIWEVSIWKN